jgi:hypothetical protein
MAKLDPTADGIAAAWLFILVPMQSRKDWRR